MVREPPLPHEHPTELQLIAAPQADWYPADRPPRHDMARLAALPVHPNTSKCVHARMLSVHAVIAVVPGSEEIRIPYLRRQDAGDFALFMDALVTELGEHPVRFTNVFMSDDAAAEAYDRVDRYLDEVAPDMNDVGDGDDRQRLEDAVDGFDHEVEHWRGPDDPVDTLVGEWDPTRSRGDE